MQAAVQAANLRDVRAILLLRDARDAVSVDVLRTTEGRFVRSSEEPAW